MDTLSLSPRNDLFHFALPKTFLPENVIVKYEPLIHRNAGVIASPIDYLNESIQSISFPGISDINITQEQHSSNGIKRENLGVKHSLGRINVEPKHDIVYPSSDNPLEKIEKEFKVAFRMNQGLYNYFMIYETIMQYICKTHNRKPIDQLSIDILNERNVIVSQIVFKDCYLDGIEGLNFDYSKMERESQTFEVTFKFNNIDFKFIADTDPGLVINDNI